MSGRWVFKKKKQNKVSKVNETKLNNRKEEKKERANERTNMNKRKG